MIDKDDILNSEKWVRVMCDFCADGIWDKKGRACHPSDLPVSAEIKTMLAGWQAWYEHNDHSKTTRWFDVDAHANFGHFIARLVKQELPDWTVIYHDEAAPSLDWSPGMPRDHFEYEINIEP